MAALLDVVRWRAQSWQVVGALFLYNVVAFTTINYLIASLLAPSTSLWMPDSSFGYSPASLHVLMQQLGADARHMFILIETFDIFFVVPGYAFLGSSLLSRTLPQSLSNVDTSFRTLQKLTLLPWVAGAADLMENTFQMLSAGLFDSLAAHRGIWNCIAVLGSIGNMAKWVLIGTMLVLLALQSIYRVVDHFKKDQYDRVMH